MSERALIVRLALGPADLQAWYRGTAREVVATAENGQTVRFPARILQPHVTQNGVHGRFRIAFDAAGRFVSIEALPA